MLKRYIFFCLLTVVALIITGGTAWADDASLFSSLIKTGKEIFTDLRELIFILAGFGIIAFSIGGIFGNLNWKWLGAIIVSLVVIATAGELIHTMVGEDYLGDDGNTVKESDNTLRLTGQQH